MAHTLATLYLPNQLPQSISADGLSVPIAEAMSVPMIAHVPMILGCAPNLVDILASGPGYIAYSIFDSEDEVNLPAMAVLSEATGIDFNLSDEDTVLRGAVLLIVASNRSV